MWSPLIQRPVNRLISFLFLFTTLFSNNAAARRVIESTSLIPCMENSQFTATLFNITFLPDANQVYIKVNGVSGLNGKVAATMQLIVYGYKALEQKVDPCNEDGTGREGFEGMCPMTQGVIVLDSMVALPKDISGQIPGIAFQVPDLDGIARIMVNKSGTDEMIACVEAPLSNGKTVDQHAVGWATAIIGGLGLLASAVTSGLGHSNTAAHVAANAVSLFGYFQTQAMIGMVAVKLPPVVAAWTQNFDWSMGIIDIGFMQDIFHWYIQATGGNPSNLRERLTEVSVQVAKRSVDVVQKTTYQMSRAAMYGFEEITSPPAMAASTGLVRRSNNNDNAATAGKEMIVVTGIERSAFKAKIEITNFFMTGLVFFIILLGGTTLAVAAFKGYCEMATKSGWMKGSKFLDFRNGWLTVLKGIMYRLVLIGFPQMAILCLWELTSRDSSGAVALAVFFILCIIGILAWASFKVIMIARRSVSLHKNPAYILYSDPSALNRWGFLYVQFRASHYYWIVPLLVYILVKGMFIAFGQAAGKAQSVGLLLVELLYLIAVSYMRPWMDKRTNIFNISICSINFLNAVFLLVFSGIFNSPAIVGGVMGVIFFVFNAIFSLVLLILILASSGYALFSKNPDVRYQPMRDDRGSFIKSNSQMLGASTELDALGATARGDMKARDLGEDDDDSSSISRGPYQNPSQVPLPPSTAGSQYVDRNQAGGTSPLSTTAPMMPVHTGERSPYRPQEQQYGYGGGGTGYGQQQPYGSQNQYGNSGNWNVGAGYNGR